MIKYFSLLLFGALSFACHSQLTVDTNLTVEQYVQTVLLGSGVTATNITYNGIPASLVRPNVGRFSDPAGNVGLTNGFIMGTGDVEMATWPNLSSGSSSGGSGAGGVDPDLQSLTAFPINDECVIEFDFIPSGDTISFSYVFASEEYPEYACGSFNDVFGFFLTGPNPNGAAYSAQNIALIPDPTNPSVYTGTAVAINSITPGVAGPWGDPVNCDNMDPNWASYSVFYVPNDGINDTLYEYDGRTVPLTAVAAVQCGQTYHIKLAIGDAGDGALDSGVFLEGNSFNSNGLSITANVTDTYEGCGNAYYIVTRSDTTINHVVPLLIQGTATNGEDYTFIPDSVVFEPGETVDTIYLETLVNDDLGAVSEDVEILIDDTDACGGPTVTILNVDPMVVTISVGDTLCTEAPMSETHTFTSTVTGGIPFGYTYVWYATPYYDFSGVQGQPTITVSPGYTTTFNLAVGDVCGNAVSSNFEEIIVECPIMIPNVFTPGNDGNNDLFVIRNIEDYPNSELVILNRWGIEVFKTTGYKNDWNGGDLTEGVYFYKLYPNGLKYETDMYQGFFQIIR
jgi:gliding motility-associated-like protein